MPSVTITLKVSAARKKALQAALDQVRDKLGEASVVPAGARPAGAATA
jgi:hypothetical protein